MHHTINEGERRLLSYDESLLSGTMVTMGFAFCRAWIVFTLTLSFAFVPNGINWPFLLSGSAGAFVVAFLASRKNIPLRALFGVTAGCIAAGCVLIIAASILESLPLFTTAIIASGVGSGLLQICWGTRFAAHDTHFSIVCTSLAAIVTGITLAIISPELGILVSMVLPVASFGIFLLEYGRNEYSHDSEGASEDAQAENNVPNQSLTADSKHVESQISILSHREQPISSKSWRAGCDRTGLRLLLSICAFSFLVRVFDAIPQEGIDPLVHLGGSGTCALILVGALFLAFSRFLKPMKNMLLAYRLSCPIMAFGLAAVALASDTQPILSVAIVCLGYELFDLLSWVIFSERAREDGRDAIAVFGCGVGFTILGMGIGYMVGGLVIAPAISSGFIDATTIVLASVVFLFTVAFLIIPESALSASPEPDESNTASEQHEDIEIEAEQPESTQPTPLSLEEACDEIAKRHKLTPRESEVLVFLARGRTLPIIARDLHIAKNTARSHIEKVYQKVDIHKQQDLIDLVEDTQQPK